MRNQACGTARRCGNVVACLHHSSDGPESRPRSRRNAARPTTLRRLNTPAASAKSATEDQPASKAARQAALVCS